MRNAELVPAIASLIVVACDLVACNEELPSRWVSAPVTIDGQPEEWTQIPLYHFRGHELAFAVQNDADNLYLFVSTASPMDQRRLGASGVTVWLNANGDHEKTRGIRFWPARSRRPRGDPPPSSDGEPGSRRPSSDGEPRSRRVPFQTVRNDTAGEIDAEVAEMFFRGTLSFEIRLPIEIGSEELALGLELPVQPVRGGETPGRGKMKGHRGGMGGGGGPGMMGGGMGSGGGPGMMGGGMGSGGGPGMMGGGGMGGPGMRGGGMGGPGMRGGGMSEPDSGGGSDEPDVGEAPDTGGPGPGGSGRRGRRVPQSELVWIEVIPARPSR